MLNPIIAIKDDFFYYPDMLRAAILELPHTDFVSPIDGVTYPFINEIIPCLVVREFRDKLEAIVGPIDIKFLFTRAMPLGHEAPNKVHSDIEMGCLSAHVYLSEFIPQGSGTSFWIHRDHGMDSAGVPAGSFDGNDMSQWEKYLQVEAKTNRIVVHSAAAWHCAEPMSGFGVDITEARLVMTCFFNLKDTT